MSVSRPLDHDFSWFWSLEHVGGSFDFVMVSECSAGNQAVLGKTVSSLLCYILHRMNGFTMLKPAITKGKLQIDV